jgi:hypothetical protein
VTLRIIELALTVESRDTPCLAACGASPDTFAQEWSGIHRSHS